jgi:hypothetical protein
VTIGATEAAKTLVSLQSVFVEQSYLLHTRGLAEPLKLRSKPFFHPPGVHCFHFQFVFNELNGGLILFMQVVLDMNNDIHF